ncbi:MAG TPA: MIP/aquaporin family protein [Baekduia sp.]
MAAEFLGTCVLILFGVGSVAMAVSALNQSGRGTKIFDASGDWLLITWGWGLAVVLGVYVAGGVTGAHLNPAVTLANAVRRGFPWAKVLPYCAAQVFGAFVGAAIVYFNYKSAIDSYNAANHIASRSSPDGVTTFSIFATFPAPYFDNWWGPFLDEVIGTALLVGVIFALTDDRNQPPLSNLAPFIVGLIVVAIGISFGANSGYAINPARDLGPRLLAWAAGWGKNAMPGDYANISTYFWIPIIAPLVGGVIGGTIYDVLIRDTLRSRGEPPEGGIEVGAETVEDTRYKEGVAPADPNPNPRGTTT